MASDRVTVCKLDELHEGRPRRIEAGGETIAVFEHEGCADALDDNENVAVRTYETTVDDGGTIRVVPE